MLNWNTEQIQIFDPALSSSFRYAGVNGAAGAITDINLITYDNLVPHDTADHHYFAPMLAQEGLYIRSNRSLSILLIGF